MWGAPTWPPTPPKRLGAPRETRGAPRSHRALLTTRTPADGADDDRAQHDGRRHEHDGDRARVAEVREVERLDVGIVVRDLGHRARPAVGEDEDQRERLDAVDEAEQRGDQEDAAQEREA